MEDHSIGKTNLREKIPAVAGFSSGQCQVIAHAIAINREPLEEFVRELELAYGLQHGLQIRLFVLEDLSGKPLKDQGGVELKNCVVRCNMLRFE